MRKYKLTQATKLGNIVHHHLNHILTANGNFKNGIYNLKQSGNYKAICQTADSIGKYTKYYHPFFYGNPFPKDIENLGVTQRNFKAENLADELNWILLGIRKYRTELTIFLNYKNDFENFFICGDYTKALATIDRCIEQFGYSVWAISSKLITYEYSSAQEKAKLLSTEVLRNNKNGLWTSSLINFLSQRAEKKLSAYKFDEDLLQAINNTKSNLPQINQEYYSFQLNFFEREEYDEIKSIITFDYTNSIIDRYLTLRRGLFYLLSSGKETEISIASINYLLKKVPDSLFNNLCLLFNPDSVQKSFYDTRYLKILDLYYSGLYEECCLEIREHIIEHPNNFTLINIYARSLVFLKISFSPLINGPCLVNEIAEYIYSICKKNIAPLKPLYGLYQISKNLDSFDINFQLSSYIKLEQSADADKKYFYFSLPNADPKICELLEGRIDFAQNVAKKICDNTFNSIALNYSINSLKGDFDSISEIDNNKHLIGKAKYLYQLKSYSESMELWNVIYNENKDVPPIFELAVEYIFRIYASMGKFDDCMRWYVDNFIENPHIVSKINTEYLHTSLKKGRFKNVSINIYLPIFISLISEDENEISFAIELFCKKSDAIMPSDLMEIPEVEKDSRFELFYSTSCNNEVLNHYRHIRTTKRRLEERINICNYLVKLNPSAKDGYIEELNLLTNELIIYEGVLKLDESKIYANDQAILNNELDEYEGLYNRYVSIAGLYLKNIQILTINKNELKFLNKKNEVEYSENDIEYSDQAYLDSFYNVFNVIRDKFLNSRYGIVTYLSTRIRHGVFLGELRPELEKRNLIFYKNILKDKYEPSPFWLNNRAITQIEKEKIIQLIIEFSNKIDSLINAIIKDNIQIKVLDDENVDGWFNYQFPNKKLADFAVEFYYENDYKSFCKKVLETLWIRTDENLNNIREVLQNNVKPQFMDLLNQFESDLYVLLGTNKMPEVFTSISESSTNLQIKLDRISNWFKRSGRTHSDFEIKNLINIICHNVQKRYPFKRLAYSINYNFDKHIKGEFYEHFNDFLMVYIDNMFKHSSNEIINCNIEVKCDEENLLVEMQSDSPTPDDSFRKMYTENNKLDGVKLITEGKSGLNKAFKIIKYDLKNENNTVQYEGGTNHFKVILTINYLNLIK